MILSSRPTLFFSILLWGAITLFGLYFLWNIDRFINFGIDLVGGTYITLEVETDKALENELIDRMQTASKKLEAAQKELPAAPKIENHTGVLTFTSDAAARSAYDLLSSEKEPELLMTLKANQIIFGFTAAQTRHLSQEAIEGNINVLRTRLDAFGVGEITIAAQGEKNILIELPNVDDPEKAKARIGKTALLELKPVFDVAESKEALLAKQGGQLPEGTMMLPGRPGTDKRESYYLVPTYAEITGRLLKDASYTMQRGDMFFKGSPHAVSFVLKPDGGEKFGDLTSKNVGGRIAIIIDNIVISAPGVDEPIRSCSAIITGQFSKQEAQELASLLKSGAFVAPVKFAEERHIGPSLGKESIQHGLLACAIALGLLLLFCLSIYKVAGIFAFIVLLYNLLLILFGLATLGATLTLPGIAGMVLTIGMAIDASILIYERIKEELALGHGMRKSVDAGFAGATAVILDANITTFIVSIVLYWLGTGPIQGFATTMMIGILATLVTGLLLLRTIFNSAFDIFGIQKIKI